MSPALSSSLTVSNQGNSTKSFSTSSICTCILSVFDIRLYMWQYMKGTHSYNLCNTNGLHRFQILYYTHKSKITHKQADTSSKLYITHREIQWFYFLSIHVYIWQFQVLRYLCGSVSVYGYFRTTQLISISKFLFWSWQTSFRILDFVFMRFHPEK